MLNGFAMTTRTRPISCPLCVARRRSNISSGCCFTIPSSATGSNIIDKRQSLQVVTAQPTIRGDAAAPAEIRALMTGMGFRELRRVRLGRLGALAFLRECDAVAAFD